MQVLVAFFAVFALASCAISTPKKYDSESGFMPSSLRYYNPSQSAKNRSEPDNKMSGSDHAESKLPNEDPTRIQRFGLSGYGNTGVSSYPQTGTGLSGYSPLKIDIGGVVLGTLIGLGAILLIPKLAHVFSSGYRRSVENELESITDVLSRFDKTLEDHHIDSSTCMQRIICTYVNDAQKNIIMGQANTIDAFIETVTSNSMLSFFLDGTAIQQAIKIGKQNDPESCTSLHARCPISKENIMQVISTLLPTS